MNEFKTTQGSASAPMTLTGDAQNKAQDDPVKWISEGIIFCLFLYNLYDI